MVTKTEPKKIFFTNTLTGKKEEFRPKDPKKVLFYSCGPTVYGPLHIGNARALIVADWLYRWLTYCGYGVEFVRNYTDVDDKILAKAKEEKISSQDVSKKYIAECEKNIKDLGLRTDVKVVKVTDSIEDIKGMIQKIIDNGCGYVVDGEVFFSIESFKDYGKLSGKKVEDLEAGARVEVGAKKKNPLDFSLWKPQKPGEDLAWDSKWGKGRPGWHIECSAMIQKWLGDTIDLHHGGQDLIFPHHENEIAQSECATGKQMCSTWVHHAFLTSGNEKMSKSLGNIATISDFISDYGAEVLKFLFLSFHYRSAVPYTHETMTQVLGELERVYLVKNVLVESSKEVEQSDETPEQAAIWTKVCDSISSARLEIETALGSDYNTSGALGHFFKLIRVFNNAEVQHAGKPGTSASNTKTRKNASLLFMDLFTDLSNLWNVFSLNPEVGLAQIKKARDKLLDTQKGSLSLSTEEIENLIQERATARKNKNFARGDEIRKELLEKGIELIDSSSGTTWKRK
ncbi:MAG: cysteine--tRNA ligase [Bacteriovoracia bacterium]